MILVNGNGVVAAEHAPVAEMTAQTNKLSQTLRAYLVERLRDQALVKDLLQEVEARRLASLAAWFTTRGQL